MMQSTNIAQRQFKNARLDKVEEKNIFELYTDWPGDSPKIRRGVQKQNDRADTALTTS